MYENKYHKESIEGKSFLITGGAGFVGSNIVEYLLKYGAKKVRVIDNLITGDYNNLIEFESNPSFEFFKGDIRSYEDCQTAVKGIDLVSHQAALGSVPRSIENPMATNDHNVNGFVNLIFAAKEEGIKRIVYASSSSVYGDEPNLPKIEERIGNQLSPYAVSKYTDELYAKVFGQLYGIEMIGFRYFNIFGAKQSPNGAYAAVIPLFVDGIIRNKTVYINGDGEQSRDFTYIENAVQANVLGMTTSNKEACNEVYNIAFGDKATVNELFYQIADLLEIKHDPIHREDRAGDIKHSLADVSKAKKLLGYNPLFNMEKGLRISLEFYRKLV